MSIGEMIKIEDLKRHIDRYGADCVLEVAIEDGVPRDVLIQLQEYIDEKGGTPKRRGRFTKQKTLTAEEKVDKLLEERKK